MVVDTRHHVSGSSTSSGRLDFDAWVGPRRLSAAFCRPSEPPQHSTNDWLDRRVSATERVKRAVAAAHRHIAKIESVHRLVDGDVDHETRNDRIEVDHAAVADLSKPFGLEAIRRISDVVDRFVQFAGAGLAASSGGTIPEISKLRMVTLKAPWLIRRQPRAVASRRSNSPVVLVDGGSLKHVGDTE